MPRLRPFHPDDLDALYAISLATGADGGDAGGLHRDGRLIGHIYSAPYAVLTPEAALVVEDGLGVGGYVVWTPDTRAFDARLEHDWWPALRKTYADPGGDPAGWTADERRAWLIHHPFRTPDAVVEAFPAHLHMNLLPRLQGQGWGSRLLERGLADLRTRGVRGAHVGVSRGNAGGLAFWQARGFQTLPRPPGSGGAVWLGRTL